jgi:hypothetical protein
VPIETIRDHLVQGVQMWRALSYAGPLFLYSSRDACVDRADPQCNFDVVTRDLTPKDILYAESDALTDAPRPSLQTGQTMLYRNSDAKPTWASGTAGR